MTDTTPAQRGRTARARGHATETAVARWLRTNGHPDAATSRSALGHSGTRQPGDIIGVPGVCIEVKAGQRPAWAAWLRQTVDQTPPSDVPVLVWRRPGIADPGRWLTLTPGNWGPWWRAAGPCLTEERTLDRCRYDAALTQLEGDPRYVAMRPVVLHVPRSGPVVTVTTLAHLIHPACRAALTRRHTR